MNLPLQHADWRAVGSELLLLLFDRRAGHGREWSNALHPKQGLSARLSARCPCRMPSGAPAAPPVVGFCFSFPVKQTALDAGTVARLTKRFENEGLLGCDPVQMLAAALARARFPARCPAR